MNKTRLIVSVAFLVVFAAGLTGGLALRATPPKPGPERSRLARDLNLTPEQEKQACAIWEGMRDAGRSSWERRDSLRHDRDEKVRALLTEEQKASYESILKDYSAKTAELSKEREKRYQDAVEKTKKLLNADQMKKYEELLKTRLNRERWRSGGSREPQKSEEKPAPSGL